MQISYLFYQHFYETFWIEFLKQLDFFFFIWVRFFLQAITPLQISFHGAYHNWNFITNKLLCLSIMYRDSWKCLLMPLSRVKLFSWWKSNKHSIFKWLPFHSQSSRVWGKNIITPVYFCQIQKHRPSMLHQTKDKNMAKIFTCITYSQFWKLLSNLSNIWMHTL